MKLFPYDTAFSRAIRERDDWTCQICGYFEPEAQATGKSMKLQCAHVFSRKNKNVRCHPDNAVCLCASCHALMTDAPTEWGLWVIKHLGEGRYDMLRERKNDIRIKYSKEDMKDIAKHYRQEYTRMVNEKMHGKQDVELISYD